MDALLTIVLTNAATAAALGLVVALAARRLSRPQVVHALWTFVLLDLLSPPVLPIGLMPRPEVAPHVTAVAESQRLSSPETFSTRPEPASKGPWALPETASRVWVSRALVGSWLAGSGLVLALTLLRARRFNRAVRGAPSAPPDLETRIAELAAAIGLRRVPRVRLVAERVSPLLRPGLHGLEILLPEALLPRLTLRERDALIVHELAHVRRRDHWARLLELSASLLFWWHPLVYGARRALRRAEEQSCDLWVLSVLPGHGRDYAQGLLKTVEWLAGAPRGLPALASGVGDFHRLEERLTMILKERASRPLSRRRAWAAAVAALAAVLVFPTWAERDRRSPSQSTDAASADPGVEGGVPGGVEGGVAGGVEGGVPGGVAGGVRREAPVGRTELERLRRQMLEVERNLERLQQEHRLLQEELARLHEREARSAIDERAKRLAEAGRYDEARQLQAEAEILARRGQMDTERLRIEQHLEARARELDAESRRQEAEAEEMVGGGEIDAAASARRMAEERAAELEHLKSEVRARHQELTDRAEALELKELEAVRARLAAEDQGDAAEALARELERRKAEMELVRARDKTAAALELMRHRLDLEREELLAQGRREEAAGVERRMRELETALRAAERRGQESMLEAQLRVLKEAVGALTGGVEANRKQDEALAREIEVLERRLQELRRKPDTSP